MGAWPFLRDRGLFFTIDLSEIFVLIWTSGSAHFVHWDWWCVPCCRRANMAQVAGRSRGWPAWPQEWWLPGGFVVSFSGKNGSEKGVYPQNDMFFMRTWWYHGIPPYQWRYGWTATKIMVDAVQWSSSSWEIQEASQPMKICQNLWLAWTWEFHSITQLSNLMVKSIPLFVFPTVFRVSARPHLPSLNLKPPSKYSLAIQWHPVIGGSIRLLCWLNPNFSSPFLFPYFEKIPMSTPLDFLSN